MRSILLPAPRALARLAALAGLLVLGACATAPGGGAIIDFQKLESAYSPSEVAYAADGRDLAVVVRTNPFYKQGISNEALAATVAREMDGGPGWFKPNFTATPGPSARELYRVAWIFGARPDTPISALCNTKAPVFEPGESADGGIVLAAFCRADKALSYVQARMPAVSSPDDPAFAAMVEQVTQALFPRRNPNKDSPNHDFLIP